MWVNDENVWADDTKQGAAFKKCATCFLLLWNVKFIFSDNYHILVALYLMLHNYPQTTALHTALDTEDSAIFTLCRVKVYISVYDFYQGHIC